MVALGTGEPEVAIVAGVRTPFAKATRSRPSSRAAQMKATQISPTTAPLMGQGTSMHVPTSAH